MSLKGKNVIITGASSGIGRSCAIECQKEGAKVHLISRNIDKLNEVGSLLEYGEYTINSLDVTKFDEIEPLLRKIVDKYGKIDGFIHSAGIQLTRPAKAMDFESYISLYEVNAVAAYEFTRNIALRYNRSTDGSSIVFISSIMSVVANPCLAAYCSSKAALLGAARSFALELARYNIRVNCVSPGFIVDSKMTEEDLSRSLSKEEIDDLKHGYPLGLGTSKDVARLCGFLLSDHARWITGQNIIVDGGYSLR